MASAKRDENAPGEGQMDAPKFDPEEFARNLIEMIEHGGKALSAYIEPRERGDASLAFPQEIADMSKTLAKVAEDWLSDPQRVVEANSELIGGYLDIWSNAVRRIAGEKTDPVMEPAHGDKRFEDPAWTSNPFFDLCMQSYLHTARWAHNLVRDAEDMDDHTRHKAEFYMKQVVNALAPTNFFLTNPAILRETVETSGENLVKGMQMLAEDIAAGQGDLRIRQTDPEAFEVGENLALTPGKVIYQNDLMQLIQYAPATEEVSKVPLLIVPPWINKFYILDLRPGKSFIEWCVAEGLTVFVVSWVNPDERLARKSFADYMQDGIIAALDVVEKVTGEDNTHLMGYCVGGTLLGVTLAYLAQVADTRPKSATFLTTQVDFTHAGDLKVFVDEEQLSALEAEMEKRGYLEGKKMASAFNLLRSNDLIWPYVVNNYMLGKAPFPFDLLYWNSDATRMPAANHSFYLRNCYLENKLTRGEMVINGKTLDLKKVTLPVYNLATREDHIAPAKSVFTGSKHFGGPVRYVMAGSGHIAGVINPPARNKYMHWTGRKPSGEYETWVKNAKEHPGSWWPDWRAWLKKLDKETVPARKPGKGRFKPIEDAPGSYVKVRSDDVFPG